MYQHSLNVTILYLILKIIYSMPCYTVHRNELSINGANKKYQYLCPMSEELDGERWVDGKRTTDNGGWGKSK